MSKVNHLRIREGPSILTYFLPKICWSVVMSTLRTSSTNSYYFVTHMFIILLIYFYNVYHVSY